MDHRTVHLLTAVTCGLLAATALGGQTIPAVSSARLRAPQPGEWLTYGREYNNQRFSPLAQINRDNVSRLTARWRLQLGQSQPSGLQVTPLVADSRMYVTTSQNVALAFDLRTRAELWRYEHKLGTVRFCCGPSNRGAALGHGLVYMATLDAHVVALDAATGAVRWDVTAADGASGYSFTMAPLVIDDLVIVGSSGGEFGTRGWVAAYAALSGALIWRWYTVPSPEEGGWWGKWAAATPTGEDLRRDLEKEKSDAAKDENAWTRGGVPVWANPGYDADLGLLYVATGNPAPSNDGTVRPGDNLYGASVVALDVKTGKLRWYFQAVPHDVWDYDFANPPVIIEQAGRKLLLEASKMGFVYVLDAGTGALVRRSEAFVPQKNLFLAPTVEGILSAPGPAGGANWPPSAVLVAHEPLVYRWARLAFRRLASNVARTEQGRNLHRWRSTPGRNAPGRLVGDRSRQRKDCVAGQDRPALEWRAGHGRRRSVRWRRQRLVPRVRREHGPAPLGVQRRGRCQCAWGQLRARRRAVHRGRCWWKPLLQDARVHHHRLRAGRRSSYIAVQMTAGWLASPPSQKIEPERSLPSAGLPPDPIAASRKSGQGRRP